MTRAIQEGIRPSVAECPRGVWQNARCDSPHPAHDTTPFVEARRPMAKNQASLEVNLKQIHARRAKFTSDYLAIETAPAVTWDETKTRLDKELTELRPSSTRPERARARRYA